MKISVKKITLSALLGAAALMLAYVEALIPPLFPTFPGIKLGLSNIVTVFAVYKVGKRSALSILIIRITLSALLFGSVTTFAYSIAGGLLSFAVMLALKKIPAFSEIGVSVAGGISHNIGQITVAVLLFSTPEIAYYLPVLLISGAVSGTAVGIASALSLKYVKLPE